MYYMLYTYLVMDVCMYNFFFVVVVKYIYKYIVPQCRYYYRLLNIEMLFIRFNIYMYALHMYMYKYDSI